MRILDLLPIGTIVSLKGGTKDLMITGVKQTNADDNIDYDYIGVMYPEGFMGREYQFLFNHTDIADVVFMGYENKEREEFITKLSAYYNE